MNDIKFWVNGKSVIADSGDADLALVDFLHERLNLTGTKFCCGIGTCHACTVGVRSTPDALMEKILSCSTSVNNVNGLNVYTVEGLGDENNLSLLQKAFLENFSFQCGYCAPGFLMAATVLVERLNISPVLDEEIEDVIKEWMGENICRCTGYVRYIEAIKKVVLANTIAYVPVKCC